MMRERCVRSPSDRSGVHRQIGRRDTGFQVIFDGMYRIFDFPVVSH